MPLRRLLGSCLSLLGLLACAPPKATPPDKTAVYADPLAPQAEAIPVEKLSVNEPIATSTPAGGPDAPLGPTDSGGGPSGSGGTSSQMATGGGDPGSVGGVLSSGGMLTSGGTVGSGGTVAIQAKPTKSAP